MARSTDEWVGKDDDAIPPPRVRLRIFDDHNGRCWICSCKIFAGNYWQADHKRALINGGENRESNLAPACRNCCCGKTAEDVAEKSKVASIRKKHLGIRKKSSFSCARTGKFKKKMNGEVVRRDT